MATPIGIYVHDPLPFHRAGPLRPVKLAEPPGGASPSGQPAAAPMPAGPTLAGSTAGALLGVDPAWVSGGASAFAQAKAAGAYGLATMGEVAALTPTAPKWAYEEVAGLGYFPADTIGDPASLKAYLREKIAAARDAARAEQAMSGQEGVEVRLAYDPNTEGAVALRPGDEGYDEIGGARAALARMRADLVRMGERPADYADLLSL